MQCSKILGHMEGRAGSHPKHTLGTHAHVHVKASWGYRWIKVWKILSGVDPLFLPLPTPYHEINKQSLKNRNKETRNGRELLQPDNEHLQNVQLASHLMVKRLKVLSLRSQTKQGYPLFPFSPLLEVPASRIRHENEIKGMLTERNKTALIYSWHNCIYRSPQGIYVTINAPTTKKSVQQCWRIQDQHYFYVLTTCMKIN